MTDPYSELQDIWNSHDISATYKTESRVFWLLNSAGIHIRRDDGKLRQMTLSKPTSVIDTLAIGLRYDKRDGTPTEDLFAVKRGDSIQSHYRGDIQRQWLEYRGTHKQYLPYDVLPDFDIGMTSCNTITFLTGSSSSTGSAT